jgi:hypothetical protein
MIKEFRAGGHGFDIASPSTNGPLIAMACRYMDSGSMEILLSFRDTFKKKRLAWFVQHERGISSRVESLHPKCCGCEWVGGSWIGLFRRGLAENDDKKDRGGTLVGFDSDLEKCPILATLPPSLRIPSMMPMDL